MKKMIPCEQAERIGHIESKLEGMAQLQTDITDIKNALLGDEYHPNNGLVRTTKDMDKRLTAVERFQYRILVWTVVVVTVLTAIMKVAELVLKSS